MTFDELFKEWEKDAQIDKTELTIESLRGDTILNKWWKLSWPEVARYHILLNERKILQRDLFEYYKGTMSEERLKELGWEPWERSLLKGEFEIYYDSNPQLMLLNDKMFQQNQKIEYIKDIIKTIFARGYKINAALEDMKLKAGIGGSL